MSSQDTKTKPGPKLLHELRQRYELVDRSSRGNAEDRAEHHASTLEDWHPHRKQASD